MRKSKLSIILLVVVLVVGIGGGSWILANGPRRPLNQPCAAEDLAATPAKPADVPAAVPHPQPAPPPQPVSPAPVQPETPEKPAAPQPQPKPETAPPVKPLVLPELPGRIEESSGKLVEITITASGSVVDGRNNPVPDVDVFAALSTGKAEGGTRARFSTSDLARKIATTDSAGRFSATFTRKVFESTRATLVLNARGGVWLADGDVRRDVANGESIDVTLKVKIGASLRGRVVDHLGRGVEGATVTLLAAALRDAAENLAEVDEALKRMSSSKGGYLRNGASTDANGNFLVSGLEPQTYRVKVNAKSLIQGADQTPEVALEAGVAGELPQPIRLTQSAAMQLVIRVEGDERVGSFTADFRSATDAADAKPRFSRSAVAKDGNVTFKDIPAGAYNVVIRTGSRLYKPAEAVAVSLVEGQTLELAALTLAKDPNAKPYPKRGDPVKGGIPSKAGKEPG
ncbi:MAG: carboxypeptidase regulatory-like domain-containing protein [Planctomycetes bacterium]|nr:carboxypeptidase regulatory-like domain-containing protein [Planctomycetota bacterium]